MNRGEAKRILQEYRETKERAKLEVHSLGGRRTPDVNKINEKIDCLVETLKNKYQNWLNEKFNPELQEYLKEIPEADIEEAFLESIHLCIKQQVKLLKKSHGDESQTLLEDEAYLEQIVLAHTYDFILSLRSYKRHGIGAPMALRLAAQSYRHSSDTYRKLKKRFSDPGAEVVLPDTAISHSMAHRPVSPESLLEEIKTQIPQLKEKFPLFQDSTIFTAAIGHPTDPESFLQSVQDQLPVLQREFPDLEEWIIIHILVKNKKDKIQKILLQIRIDANELQEHFPELSRAIIIRTCVQVEDKEKIKKMLQKILDDTQELREASPDANPSLLDHLAKKYPHIGVEKKKTLLKDLEQKAERLQTLYPKLDRWIINEVIISTTGKEEDQIKKLSDIQKTIDNLQKKFSQCTPGLIKRAVVLYPTYPEEYLQNILHQEGELKLKYPDFKNSILRLLVVYGQKAEEMIKKDLASG